MNIELIDLKKRFQEEKVEIMNCLEKVLKEGTLVLTKEVNNFEESICQYTGSKFCLGLNSGTDAIMMALWSNGIGKGDEVFTSPISFIASIGAIVHVGAKPVFVDIKDDLNFNEELIESAITSKTKAIMPVHWTGRICNMEKIISIAKKHNLIVIEDAAQAMGSYHKGQHGGRFGKISAFSAHPLKNLNALGDSGFIITDDIESYNKIKLYRNHGLESRDNVKIFGVNSRLDSLNAEILTYRLKKLSSIIERRKNNIEFYQKYLNTNKIKIPFDNDYEKNSYVMFICLCEDRDNLQKYLNNNNIQSLVYYGKPLHLHEASKKLGYKKGSFPNAEDKCNKVLALPHHQHLREEEIKYVCDKINSFYK